MISVSGAVKRMWLLLAIVVVAVVGGLVSIGCTASSVFTSNPLSWSSLISTSRCSTPSG
ncbi:membrane protein MmpS2 [Mycobacterium tuberculosis variant microti]|nr:membrane protein MmpS2 [Mycobacterium tuberculosis variant bovis BCG]AMC57992.1 membrane protein MmpS2 [Mycobacterium tuberculosis variant microti]AMC62368.1 membrane protein MmpS2 [Mycobacterium tuberculosis variant africanum]CKN36714.1 Uncharacterised protein [Mycobacterium tuberculosis]CKP80952.1 Uncharacterised protein [Mycobacterium tuberculosis]